MKFKDAYYQNEFILSNAMEVSEVGEFIVCTYHPDDIPEMAKNEIKSLFRVEFPDYEIVSSEIEYAISINNESGDVTLEGLFNVHGKDILAQVGLPIEATRQEIEVAKKIKFFN